MSRRQAPTRGRFQFSSMGITRGALIVLGLELGMSLVWILSPAATRYQLEQYLLATPENVFEHGRVWTLATSWLLEPSFLGLVLNVFMMWAFVPTLERFWGTARFYRFVAITSLVGTTAGVAVGQLVGMPNPINGLSPFMWSAIVAFGIIYARQPVQFFGVLPLTGRQMMYGFLGFLVLFVGLQQLWSLGAAYAAAMTTSALMVSKRWSPGLAWKRWRIQRARAKLTVMQGGASGKKPAKPDEQKWLN